MYTFEDRTPSIRPDRAPSISRPDRTPSISHPVLCLSNINLVFYLWKTHRRYGRLWSICCHLLCLYKYHRWVHLDNKWPFVLFYYYRLLLTHERCAVRDKIPEVYLIDYIRSGYRIPIIHGSNWEKVSTPLTPCTPNSLDQVSTYLRRIVLCPTIPLSHSKTQV